MRHLICDSLEDPLVELPEHIDVPDPPFSFILAHLVSHIFCVEPPVEAADGEPPDALQDFDPLDSLSRFHEGGEWFEKNNRFCQLENDWL